MNVLGYLSMRIDKKKAIEGKRRISEKRLFMFALLGGSLGSIIGMQKFRHKTKHWYFKYGMPFILVIQLIVAFIIIHLASKHIIAFKVLTATLL